MDSVEEIPARLGSDVDLYCRLSGNSQIRWERPDGRALNQRAKPSADTGLLSIQNVQPQDAGVYLCIRGQQTQYVRLEINTYSEGKQNIVLKKPAFLGVWCS